MAVMPAWVRALPKPVKDALKIGCSGEWSRVVRNDDGSWTIRNEPSRAVRPAQKSYRQIKTPPANSGALGGPQKAVQRAPEPEPVKAPVTGWLPPERQTDMPVVPPRRKVVMRGNVEGLGPRLAPEVATESAFKLMTILHKGMGHKVPLAFYEEVLATTGLDLEDAEAIVREADRVEVRPESALKGYPILRFTRGDVDVIVGFRDPYEPCVIRIDQGALLQHDTHRVYSHGGGGRKKEKGTGTPNQPEAIRRGLMTLGCQVPEFDYINDKAVKVTYKGQEIGMLSHKAITKDLGQRLWDGFYRKWDAINRKPQ